jgi:E3 ubiquitin-protein ligase TRIP12
MMLPLLVFPAVADFAYGKIVKSFEFVFANRMIDLPFSLPFFQWLLNEEATLSTIDLRNIDPTIATTVTQLESIVRKKRRIEEDAKMTPTERQAQIKNLTMDGCPIEDLGLDFTLPGYAGIELRKGGKDTTVTIENLHYYVRLVTHWLLVEGVNTQVPMLKLFFFDVTDSMSKQASVCSGS